MAQLFPIKPDPMIPMWAEDEEAMSNLQDWTNWNKNLYKNVGKALGYEARLNEKAMYDPEDSCQLNFLTSPFSFFGWRAVYICPIPCFLPETRRATTVRLISSIVFRCVGLGGVLSQGSVRVWLATMVYKRSHADLWCSTFAITSGHICFWFPFRFYQRSLQLSREDIFCVPSFQMKSK